MNPSRVDNIVRRVKKNHPNVSGERLKKLVKRALLIECRRHALCSPPDVVYIEELEDKSRLRVDLVTDDIPAMNK